MNLIEGTLQSKFMQRPVHPREKRLLRKGDIAELLESGTVQVMKWEDDDVALRAAAEFSRMPPDRMTSQEAAAFPDIFGRDNSMQVYLFIRNKILQLWMIEPLVEVTPSDAKNEIMPPFNSDITLVRSVHAFLERFGYINYGCFHAIPKVISVVTRKRKIMVIGAGAAGIGAASQLKHFGFDVTVIEARGRIGGRISTYTPPIQTTSPSVNYEIGAETFHGISGNPFVTLSKQLRFNLKTMPTTINLYDCLGMMEPPPDPAVPAAPPVSPFHDQRMEEIFDEIMGMIHRLVHEKGITHANGRPLTMRQAFVDIVTMFELKHTERRRTYLEMYEGMIDKISQLGEEARIYKKSAELIADKIEALQLKTDSDIPSLQAEIMRRCLRRELKIAIKKFDEICKRRRVIDAKLPVLVSQKPSDRYFSDRDIRTLEFHISQLEYLNGCPLTDLAVTDWGSEAGDHLEGCQSYIPEGMSEALEKWCAGGEWNSEKITPLTNQTVRTIEYNEKGVTVYLQATNEPLKTMELSAEAVVVTVPLGVLKSGLDPTFKVPKKSVSGSTLPRTCPRFKPPLPQWKLDAIRSMGYGRDANKLCLVFASKFWKDDTVDGKGKGNEEDEEEDAEVPMIGRIPLDSVSRGELSLFRFHPRHPVVYGYCSGHADRSFHSISLDVAIRTKLAMAVLRRCFPSCPEGPVSSYMTCWYEDPYSFGVFSHLSPTSKVSDFDDLAAPVRCHSEEGPYKGPERVFFAGEHTSKNFPASMHGALLSGFREAGRIADIFLGCSYAPPVQCPVTIESDSEEEEL